MSRKASESEVDVLQVVCDLEEATAGEVYEACPKARNWAPATVITFLRRLEAKGFVAHFTREGSKAYVYHPTEKGRLFRKRMVNDLVERLFGGNPFPLVSYLLEETALEESQVLELKRLIDESQNKGERRP